MDPQILDRLSAQEAKLDAIFKSVERTRKLFLAIVWVTIITFVLPLILMLFAIPRFIDTYQNTNTR
jgi:hypothetical protein